MGLRISALLPILASLGLSCQLEKPRDEPSLSEVEAKPALAEAPSERGASQNAIPLNLWPAKTSMMVGLDVATINESPMKSIFSSVIQGGMAGLLPNETACQRRLIGEIEDMLFIQGFTGAADNSVVVIRGIKRSEVEECVPAEATIAAQKSGPNYGALDGEPEKHLIWWHDAETFLLSSDGGKKAIDLARPDKLRAPTNAELLKSIARVDTSAAIWIAAVEPPAGMNPSVVEIRGSVHLKQGLNAAFRMQYDNADSASEAVKNVEGVLGTLSPFAKYLEESRVRAEGRLLKFDLSMTSSRVAEFAKDPTVMGLFPESQTTPQ